MIISQPFNVPEPLKDTGHHGVDLGSYDFKGKYLFGIPVKAIFAGKIAGMTFDRPPIGNVIIIESTYAELPEEVITLLDIKPGQSLYHMYAHLMNSPDWKIGDTVSVGETIDYLGKSQTVEAHLHLEMVIGRSGETIPGMAYYQINTTDEERETYLRWRASGEFVAFDPMLLFPSQP